MTFTEESIKNKDFLEQQILEEADRIYNSKTARRGRSLQEIKDWVRIGKVAEVYLIETGKYKPANKMYHDLINEDGDYVEVKAYNVFDSEAPFVKKDLERIRNRKWNHSKWYMLFQHKNGTYAFLEKILI